MDLYHKQHVRNWGVPLGHDEESDDREALRTMLDPLQDCDIDSFLSEETAAWCTRELLLPGFNNEINDPQRPFLPSYIQLRQRIQEHQQSGQLPILSLSPINHGGAQQFVRNTLLIVRLILTLFSINYYKGTMSQLLIQTSKGTLFHRLYKPSFRTLYERILRISKLLVRCAFVSELVVFGECGVYDMQDRFQELLVPLSYERG